MGNKSAEKIIKVYEMRFLRHLNSNTYIEQEE